MDATTRALVEAAESARNWLADETIEGALRHADRLSRALSAHAAAQADPVGEARDRLVRYAIEARLHQDFPVGDGGLVDQSSREYQSYIATLADLWRSVDAVLAAEQREGGGDDA